MNTYVISTGGVGSSSFIKHLGVQVINEERGFSAHERDPRKPKAGGRVLYIFGNPYNQVLSFYRRGFFENPYMHCVHVGGLIEQMTRRDSWTLTDFLDNGVDFFLIEEHFNAWLRYSERQYEIMFARYEKLYKYTQKIFAWLEHKSESDFEFTQRASDWVSTSPIVQHGLHAVYGKFYRQLRELPDLFEMKGDELCAC